MDKVKAFIDKHVQWVALGIGVLYLLYIVYAYVLTPPVLVDVGAETLPPGQVDEAVLSGPAESLRIAMEPGPGNQPVLPAPKDFLTGWSQRASMATIPSTPLAGVFPPLNLPPIGPGPDPSLPPGPNAANGGLVNAGKVEKLPSVVPLEAIEAIHGRSTVEVPVPAPQANAGNPNQPQPQPNVQPVTANLVDKTWVTAFFKLNMQSLAKAFQEARIPAISGQTMFLDVQLVRQEQKPDGTWGDETVVPRVPVWVRPDMPATGAGPQVEIPYRAWAEKNTAELINPAFFRIVKGDFWRMPGQPLPQQPGQPQEQQFDPANPPPGPLTPAQQKAVRDYNLKQKQEEQRRMQEERRRSQPERRTGPGPDREPRMPRGDRGPRPAPMDDDRPRGPYAQVREYEGPRPDNDGPRPGGFDPGMPGSRGGFNPRDSMFNEQLNQQQFQQPGVPGSPINGLFDPTNSVDVTLWAHDDTVVAGKTYRYRLRYKLLNPIYGTANIAKDQAMSKQFALDRDEKAIPVLDTEWTTPVTIQTVTKFWIAKGIFPGSDVVTVDVTTKTGGDDQLASFTVRPGDVIGGKAANLLGKEVEYDTGWTLVDVKTDHILIMNEDGKLERREVRADMDSPERSQLRQKMDLLQQQIQQQNPGAVGSLGGPGPGR